MAPDACLLFLVIAQAMAGVTIVAVYCMRAMFPVLGGLIRLLGPWMPLSSSSRM